MLHVYEFEVFDSDGVTLAFPYDLDGGTQGEGFADACESAAGWLQCEMEHRALHDLPFPEATFGNEPEHEGGRTVIVAVNADKGTVRRLTGAEAARRLGVAPGRVTQMADAGQLESFELDGRRLITEESVAARLAAAPKAGRSKRPTAKA